MEKQGLIVQSDDPFDRRRAYLELASDASLAVEHYFSQLEHPLGDLKLS